MMDLKIKSLVRCSDREVGEISHVIVNAVTKEISHLVLSSTTGPLLVPVEDIASSKEGEAVVLRGSSSELSKYPAFRHEDYLELKEVELAGVEQRLKVNPGEPLVRIPELEKDVSRRKFFTNFTNAIGVVLALPLIYPIFRYITQPMYVPFDNTWFQLADVSSLEVGKPQLIHFTKKVKEAYMEREFRKSHWVVKPSDEFREQLEGSKDGTFKDSSGEIYWKNDPKAEVVVMAGKCPHLGCAFKWKENHRRFGQVFWCPCHLSIFSPSGEVLDGPSPRRLDVIPSRTNDAGRVEIIDAEFKAGKAHMIRVI